MNHNRWYDEYPKLSILLEKLKNSESNKKDKIFLKIKNLIIELDSQLINKHVLKFPMNQKRRWYDQDPYSWLIINSLKFADKKIINKTISLLEKELK